MFSKVLALIFTLLIINACSSTKDSANSGGTTAMTEDKYRAASSSLNTFDPIKGSKVGARANDRVFFSFDSSTLSSTAQRILDKQAKWLKNNSSKRVTIEGHCDERGTREYNLALGDRRANVVKSYLVNSGISSSRISVVSYGKERPAVLGSNHAAWAENRRSVTVLK